jgi:hypothetical protein
MYQIDSTSEHNSVKAWPILANLACWGSQSWPQTENRETFEIISDTGDTGKPAFGNLFDEELITP